MKIKNHSQRTHVIGAHTLKPGQEMEVSAEQLPSLKLAMDSKELKLVEEAPEKAPAKTETKAEKK